MPARAATRRDIDAVPVLSAPRFTGRGRELAALAGALAKPPAVVLVEGEAGIGKSRLVREYLASPEGRRHRALTAACPPFRQPCTLGPVADAIRQAAGDVRGLGLSALAGALRPLFPEWDAALPPSPEPVEDAGAARYRVYRALAEVLDGLGIGVVVAEDVHWADEATLEFLLFLASRQHDALSLVVTYRPEDVPGDSLLRRLSSRLPAGTTGARISVSPLDEEATGELAASMLDGKPVSREFAAFLHEHAEGLPLAVEETIRLMADRADLEFRGSRWVRRHLADIEVPPTVRDAVLERTARLDPDAQAVLRAAAVLAEPVSEPVLLAVSGLARHRQESGLMAALSCGLLTENSGPYGAGLICFRHALAARTVYEAMPLLQRQRLHLRSGRALEKDAPLPVAQLARHFRVAGDTAQWCRYGEQAADLALAAGDHGIAASLLQDLVTDGSLPGRDAARLTAKIPMPALAPADAARLVEALRKLLGQDDTASAAEGEVRCQLGRMLVGVEEWNAAHAELERAVPHLAGDPVAAVKTMTLLGLPIGWTDWPAARHLHWLQRAAATTAAMTPAEKLGVQINRITALLMLGEEEGWAEAAHVSADAPVARERLEITRGILNVGEAAILWGRYTEAGDRLRRARELAESQGQEALRNTALVMQARLAWSTGAWSELASHTGALVGNEEIPPLTRLKARLVGGLLATVAGDAGSAGDRLAQVMQEARTHGSIEDFMEAAGALARLRLGDGAYDEALQVTDEPAGVVSRKGVWLWATEIAPPRVSALLATGRNEQAAVLVTGFTRGLSGRDAPAPKAALATCRALLAQARGEQERAARLFGRAAAAWQACPRPYDALLAREQQGRCLLAAGQDQAGLDTLVGVREGLGGLGAAADSGRVSQTLRDHGVKVTADRGHRRSYGNQLSPRELEVVRLLVAGRTVREIAGTLFLSPKTVDCHVDSARRKLNAPSRVALAAVAVESGIVPAPGSAGRPQK